MSVVYETYFRPVFVNEKSLRRMTYFMLYILVLSYSQALHFNWFQETLQTLHSFWDSRLKILGNSS